MTPNDVLIQSVELYDTTLIQKIKLVGRQVLFVDDSPEMLNLIKIMLQNHYNVLDGYIIEPNPVFAKHVLSWYIEKKIELSELIKCAVLDIDFGIYSKSISVNDLIALCLDHGVPVVLFSAIDPDAWHNYVNPAYHDKVTYICKTDPHSMNQIYSIITERELNVVSK